MVLRRSYDGASPSRDVLMVITRDQRRGPELFAATLAGELRSRGVSVRLCSLASAPTAPGLGVVSFGKRPLDVRTLLRLRREMATSDVVIAFGSKTLPACAMAGVGAAQPVIYQNIGDPLFWAAGWARRTRVRMLLRRTAAVAALTEQSAGTLQSVFGVPRSKIQVIRNARCATTFRPATADKRRQARALLGVLESHVVVAVVASLTPEKRIDLAIDAVALMRPDVRLLVVGSGPLEAQLRDHAEGAAPGRVQFVGTREDVSTVYSASDAVLLTSASEGVPGVLVEASLCGVPVVSTDVGFVRDVVVPGETGVLVREPTPGNFASGLEHVLARRREMGEKARIHSAQRFSLDEAVDGWVALIASVLDRKDGRVSLQN
jgi:glycosyltransferase involved in cell wall biosynthesis